MKKSDSLPNIENLIKRRVYKIKSRNLSYGVWNGEKGKDVWNGVKGKIAGFIGIRTKFNDRYLFTEFHYDACQDFGTVYDAIDTGIDVPDNIEIKEFSGLFDLVTNRAIDFKKTSNYKKWYFFLDTNEYDDKIRPCYRENKLLFDFLDEIEKENIINKKHL